MPDRNVTTDDHEREFVPSSAVLEGTGKVNCDLCCTVKEIPADSGPQSPLQYGHSTS